MKKLLIIAPSSFPVIDAESIVNIKLLKVLSKDEDISIDLVSRKRKWEGYPSMSLDSYGVRLKSINIVEVDNKITIKTLSQTLLAFLRWHCLFKGCHWATAALPIVNELVRNNVYDCVITKNEPSFLLGYHLKKKGLKWVASWNDPYPVSCYPEPYGRGYEMGASYMDKKAISIMKKADVHIVPSIRLRDYMNAYLKDDLNKFVICAHVVTDINGESYKNKQLLKLISSGKLKKPRDVRPFLLGLKKFVEKTSCRNLLFTIVGEVPEDTQCFIKNNKLEDLVEINKPVDYNSSLELLMNNHIGVIIEANCENGIFLPTKVSDCMQCNISILALSPQNGLLHDLYGNGSIPYFAETSNIDSIAYVIESIYNDFINDNLKNNKIPKDFEESNIVNIYKNL